jgi:hypothetical protein
MYYLDNRIIRRSRGLNTIFITSSIAFFACFWLVLRRLYDLDKSLRWIAAGVVSLFFLRIILGEAYFLWPMLIFQALILIIGFLLLLHKIIISSAQKDSELIIYYNFFDKAYLGFLLILIFSTIFSVNINQSLITLIYFFSLYVWYCLISNLPKNAQVDQILKVSILSATLLLIGYAIYQYGFGFAAMRQFLAENPQYMVQAKEFIKRVNSNTVFASFMYPPAFGIYLAMMFLIILGFCLSESSLFKPGFNLRIFLQYIVLLAIIPVIILTKSKGAWFALLIGSISFLLISQKNFKLSTIFKIIGLFSFFILSFFLIGLSDKVHLPKFNNIFISLGVRLEYWKAAWKMITERWF